MTLQEALRSGKRFKRPGFADWELEGNAVNGYSYALVAGPRTTQTWTGFFFDRESILADDWIVEDPSVTVTRADVVWAWEIVHSGAACSAELNVFLGGLGL